MSRSTLLIASVLFGCASTVGGTSAHPSDGSVSADVSVSDVAARLDAPSPPDVTTACAGDPAIDGDARAITSGLDARFVVRAAEMAPGRPRLDDDGCGPRGGATHAFSLRFTARQRAWLRVSVEAPEVIGDVVDRVVVARGCGAEMSRIACAGASDPSQSSVPGAARVTARTEEPVAAGETLTVSVGSLPRDVVVRVVSVVVERPLGGACDPEEGRDVCASNGRCVRGTCVPSGALEGSCRVGATACDPGLTCVGGTTAGPRGACMNVVSAGAPCAYGDACGVGVCDVGSRDLTCQTLGAFLNRCRASEPRCDAPLRCARSEGDTAERCYRALSSGAPCEQNGRRSGVCPSGERCVMGAAGLRCARDGAAGGRCRASSTPCDAGLACGLAYDQAVCVVDPSIATRGGRCASSPLARCGDGLACDLTTSRCVDALAAGSRCSLVAQTCAAGLVCGRTADGASTQGRCTAPGAEGGACRALPTACDAGLVCSRGPVGRCVRPLPFDGICDDTDPTHTCGGVCIERRCRPLGSRSGPCRDVGEACETGLTCVSTIGGPRCVVPLAAGAHCTRDVVDAACAPGTGCHLPAGAGEARCLDDGTLSPPCASDGRCAPGRRCVGGLCRPVVADGELCFGAIACAPGSSCIYPDASVFAGQCVRDGAPGAACRLSDPACDAGGVCRAVLLTPWRAGQCVIEARVGETCGTSNPPRVCASGLTCVAGRCAR